ncbi:MAG: class I SAM-dependent methyltransferase [Candidatus Omnitrophica bacterium]|nr:class I SAM-dependent methyltransferase [Candidatus Omnitrophota bacterium]
MDNKQIMQDKSYYFPYHYLSLVSGEYRYFEHAEYINRLKFIKTLIDKPEGKTLIDAGCGDGRFCYEFAGMPMRIVGIDHSEKALAFARAFNPGLEFIQGDIADVDPDFKADIVVMLDVLEHIPLEKVRAVVSKAYGFLKDHGKLILSVPSILLPPVDKHYQHFTEEKLRESLKGYFTIKSINGHTKMGPKREVFSILRRLSFWLYPWFKKSGFIRKVYERFEKYGATKLGAGRVEDCQYIIAVSEKVS